MVPKSTAPSEIPQDEHVLLDDNKYIADVLCEFKNAKAGKVTFHICKDLNLQGVGLVLYAPVLIRIAKL